MAEMRRVVVTGVGAVTPVGNTAEEFWAALIQGKSGIGPVTRFDASPLPTRIAGELKGFDSRRYIHKKDDRKLDPFLTYAITDGQKFGKPLQFAPLPTQVLSADKKTIGEIQ